MKIEDEAQRKAGKDEIVKLLPSEKLCKTYPYLIFLSLDSAFKLVQILLQLTDNVCLSLHLVKLCLPLALQQGVLHLHLKKITEAVSETERGRKTFSTGRK